MVSKTESESIEDKVPPIRSAKHTSIITSSKTETLTQVNKFHNFNFSLFFYINLNYFFKETKNSQVGKKSVKPRDYREWEKWVFKKKNDFLNFIDLRIEKQIDKELEEKENIEKITKVTDDKSAVNHGKNLSKSLIKDLPKDINTESKNIFKSKFI